MKLFIFAWALALVTTVQAQSNPLQVDHNLTSAQFQSTYDSLVPQGYRLNYVSGYTVNNDPRFAAIWERKASVAWIAHIGLTFAQFQQDYDTYQSQGYRLIVVNGYTVNGVDYYADIWDQSQSIAWAYVLGYSSFDYAIALITYAAANYTLKHVSGYDRDTSATYAAIWEQTNDGIGWVSKQELTASDYETAYKTYVGQGYRLVFITGYQVNNVDFYAAIWDLSVSGLWAEQHNLTSSEYQNVSDSYVSLGYTPKIVSGYDIGQTPAFGSNSKCSTCTTLSSNVHCFAGGECSPSGLIAPGLRLQ